MPKTLLAVDDSTTMRKVLEITFSGEDFNVVSADSAQAALAKMAERPAAVIIDTALGSDDGYALCREIRKRDAGVAIVLLSSRYNPYDAAKGKEAGADDSMDKPFDTQQFIDKVRKAILTREGAGAGAPAPAAAAQPAVRPQGGPQVVAAGGGAGGAKPARSQTLMFGEGAPPAAQAAVAAARAAVTAPEPTRTPNAAPVRTAPQAQSAQAAPAPHASSVSASVNGQLASRLGDLGLSQSQVDAVLALSRDVVERVVWEVVPQLAEALIKEEIARLTRP